MKCKFCGEAAGWFNTAHSECRKREAQRIHRLESGRLSLVHEATQMLLAEQTDFSLAARRLEEIEERSQLPVQERNSLLARAWSQCLDKFLEDGLLSAEEEAKLAAFRSHFALTQDILDRDGSMTRAAKAGALRELVEGGIPTRLRVPGGLPFNFQASEQMVWAFPAVRYLQDRVRKQYVGQSQGLSIRVAKGVYYRTSGFRGHVVESTETKEMDRGWLALTTKHLYFGGSHESLRIPYKKVVSFQPFSNGIGLMRDVANAKLQSFVNDDGWFTYNLVANLAARVG
jgi:hypothetical protein